MSYVPGYTYDIYISYSGFDLLSFGTGELLRKLYVDLELNLARRVGKADAIKIYWDRESVDEPYFFNTAVQDRIAQSAIMLCIVSNSYLSSVYCRKSVQFFAEQVRADQRPGSKARMINLLLYNIPLNHLMPEMKASPSYAFYKAEGSTDMGTSLSHLSEQFQARINELTNEVAELLSELMLVKLMPLIDIVLPEKAERFEPLNEGKLILIGRGEVGKTSLVNRLVNNTFDKQENKTPGISITKWPLQSGDTQIKVNIWDFGGQEIMHATHQFFMTERSLYLLVLNGREGGVDEDVEYWLKHIQVFGKDSPVIIVQNKINQQSFELNYRALRDRYPQIREFVKTDCEDNVGLDDLRSEIESTLLDMPDVRIELPLSWFAVKQRLEEMKENFIGYDKFREICREEGINEDADRQKLSLLLHCLGIILHYHDDLRLRETNVLKPEWVTTGIYKLLNSKIIAQRKGELHLNDLNYLLPPDFPLEKHFFLLELMRKFSLIFSFPEDTQRYLIPELLGKEEPPEVGDFSPQDCLCFEYHYSVLPEGLIPRFIVLSHVLSQGEERWRSGLILAHENCKALVKAEIGSTNVIIRVKGSDVEARHRLLQIIRYDMDKINKQFSDRIKIDLKVPLPDHPDFSVDYEKLLAFEKGKVNDFRELVDNDIREIQVKVLLDGVDYETSEGRAQAETVQPQHLFLSYAHEDEKYKNELEVHLRLLGRQNLILPWNDRKIRAGEVWDQAIRLEIERAKIIILLVSADFFASDYIWNNEIKLAMEKHEEGSAIVIPLIIRHCDWVNSPFRKLQALPKDAEPIASWPSRDKAWTEVAAHIRSLVSNEH